MDALSILGVSLGVGVVVYALSLRSADAPIDEQAAAGRSPLAWLRERTSRSSPDDLGFASETSATAEPVPEGFVYVPVLAAKGPGWRTRLSGAVGLVALVAVGAIALALGAYQIGYLINELVSGFLGRS